MKTNNITVDKLAEIYQYPNGTHLSEAIILSALSANEKNEFLPIKVYRENAFSELWQKQFHHGAHWTAQYRSELNQGKGRLAHRVFESCSGKGYDYRLRSTGLSKEDILTINKLKKILEKIKRGHSMIDDDNEEVFQQNVSIRPPIKLKSGKIVKPKKNKTKGNEKYTRNAGIAKTSLIDAEYKCQINQKHETFYYPITKNNFVEAHHLIPMKYQDDFKYSIDVTENIIALCPNCHRKIHYGTIEEINKLILSLYDNERKKLLKSRGISVTTSKLKEYYK